MQRIGFKEWALVCAALGEGRQTVIIRKGGLAEGRDGFAFRHREFFLFPTFFHEQMQRVRTRDATLPAPLPDEIEIRYFARVEEARVIRDWDEVRALEPLHILQESVVRERFDYDDAPGVHVAFVRVFQLEPVWRFPDSKAYAGCRSWVTLPAPPAGLQRHPVLSEARASAETARLGLATPRQTPGSARRRVMPASLPMSKIDVKHLKQQP